MYDVFREASVIGPETPEIQLERGVQFDDQQRLDDQIKRTMAIRRWLQEGRPEHAMPRRSLDSYVNQPRSRATAQIKSVLQGYFERIQKSDLLIIPPGSYAKDTLIAEAAEEPGRMYNMQFERFFAGYEIPVRRFNTLGLIERRKLPSSIQDIISYPNMLVNLGRSEHDFFYGLAYGSYMRAGENHIRLKVTEESYNTTDDFYILAFLNFVAFNTKSVTIEGSDEVLGFRDAAFRDSGEFSPSFKSNINSPGWLQLSSPYIIPIVVAALMSVAVEVGVDAHQLANNGELNVVNSLAEEDDPCTLEVKNSVIKQLQLLEIDEWQEACRFAREAKEQTGLKSPVVVERD